MKKITRFAKANSPRLSYGDGTLDQNAVSDHLRSVNSAYKPVKSKVRLSLPKFKVNKKTVFAFVAIVLMVTFGIAAFSILTYQTGNVLVTNVSSRSATITWTTNTPSKGAVIVSESSTNFPLNFGFLGGKQYFDDRDVSKANLLAAQKNAEAASNPSSDKTVVTDVNVTDLGSYYVHHVTVTNLNPQATYKFWIGDGNIFVSRNDKESNIDKFTTFAEVNEVGTPLPTYGFVNTLNDKVFDSYNDAVVYLQVLFPGENDDDKESQVISAVTSNNGSWYMDLSGIRYIDGSVAPQVTQDLNEKVWADAGVKGYKDIFLNNTSDDAPMDPITLQTPVVVSESFSSPIVFKTYADDCECAPAGGCATGQKSIRNTGCSGTQKACCGVATSTAPATGGGTAIDTSGEKKKGTACQQTYPENGMICYKKGVWEADGTCSWGAGSNCVKQIDATAKCDIKDSNCPVGQCALACGSKDGSPMTCVGGNGNTSCCTGECVKKTQEPGKPASGGSTGGTTTGTIKGTCSGNSCSQGQTCGNITPTECSCSYYDVTRSTVVSKQIKPGAKCGNSYNGEEDAYDQTTNNLASDCTYSNGQNYPNGYVASKSFYCCDGIKSTTQCTENTVLTRDPNDSYHAKCGGDGQPPCTDIRADSCDKDYAYYDCIKKCKPVNTLNSVVCRSAICCTKSESNSEMVSKGADVAITTKTVIGTECTDGFTELSKSACASEGKVYICISNGAKVANITDCSANNTGTSVPKPACEGSCNAWRDGSLFPTTGGKLVKNPNGNCDCILNDGTAAQRQYLSVNEPCLTGNCRCSPNALSYPSLISSGVCQWSSTGCGNGGSAGDSCLTSSGKNGRCAYETSGVAKCVESETELNGVIPGKLSPKILATFKVKCLAKVDGYPPVTLDDGRIEGTYLTIDIEIQNKKKDLEKQARAANNNIAYSCTVTDQVKTDVFSQNNYVFGSLAASSTEKLTDIYIDPVTGILLPKTNQKADYKYKGKVYQLDLSTSDPLSFVYIDNNENDKYDEGTDDKIDIKTFVENSVQVEKDETIVLKPGFNFVSFPYVISAPDGSSLSNASDLLGYLNEQSVTDIYSIAQFESGHWVIVGKRDDVTISANDFPIIPGRGYLIKSNSTEIIRVIGKYLTKTVPINISVGWNLIGLNGTTKSYTAESLLDAINTSTSPVFQAVNVTQWPSDKQKYEGIQKEKDDTGVVQVYGFDFPIDTKTGYFLRNNSGTGTWTPQ